MASPKVIHVAAAGVAAGVVINVTATAFWSFVLPTADSYFWGFVFGILAVSLYAAMSAKSGPSPARAVVAGMTLWMVAAAVPNYVFFVAGVLTQNVAAFASVLGFIEVVPAAILGAWAYDWAATTQQAHAQKHQSGNASTTRLTPHTPLNVKAI